jgi:hypothetical protein
VQAHTGPRTGQQPQNTRGGPEQRKAENPQKANSDKVFNICTNTILVYHKKEFASIIIIRYFNNKERVFFLVAGSDRKHKMWEKTSFPRQMGEKVENFYTQKV